MGQLLCQIAAACITGIWFNDVGVDGQHGQPVWGPLALMWAVQSCEAACATSRCAESPAAVLSGSRLLLQPLAAAPTAGMRCTPSAPLTPNPRLSGFPPLSLADNNAWALTAVLCLFEVFFEVSICTLSWVRRGSFKLAREVDTAHVLLAG